MTIDAPRLQVAAHPVEFLGEGLLVRGNLHTARRVTDVLNEDDKWVQLTDVQVWPVPTRGPDPVDTVTAAHFRKVMIEVASEFGITLGSERAQEMGMHTAKVPHRVQLHTPSYKISADMHVSADANVETALALHKGSFVPMTMAIISPEGQGPEASFSRDFLLVNVDRISYVSEAADSPPIQF